MDSNSAHSPVFLVFPPEITVSKLQSPEFIATTYESSGPFPKSLTTKMKTLGAIQILFGLLNFSFGVVFLFTLENPYPRFPFVFISGYPFWSSVLVKTTQAMNSLSALAATAGIILIALGLVLDQNYFCGHEDTNGRCWAINTLFIGILIMLMAFSVIELFISLSFSILKRCFYCCNCD
ncbi:membrane-spanning 4-domains subfamily A member 5 isoform X2 [Panthera onca]|uniref:membrane-spanning 4-domains subfamily A member 5 isoform X2 n=1 Tax=Panthera leo TaxID=9689 RepID=UPI001C69782D|nr:membrane-spanning 4-domains subfamily A member 5 isoform X2 [Panthera leo]XP_060462787.1 membrane-spanning 4-domains subfamily A member 5 isoform X2 [Panthera onca]